MQGVDADQHAGEAEAEILQAAAQASTSAASEAPASALSADPAAAGEEQAGSAVMAPLWRSGAAFAHVANACARAGPVPNLIVNKNVA